MTAVAEPRIAGHPAARYPWYVRLILWLQRRKYGRALEPALLWGRIPRAFLMLTLLYRSLDRKSSPLEPALRSLVQVRISQINWCAFCVDLNSAAALERHAAAGQLSALSQYENSFVFSERERAALAYAEAVTDPARRVDDAMFVRLRQHFSEQEIIELTALIAFQNMSSKFNSALAVPSSGFCALPTDAPQHPDGAAGAPKARGPL
ncbi:MAG: carboxymuconolactone decarboxylase family protein [Betaproteobacteria bacterium]|nr:carboxymuconolactone decarboxylase family protein [Betaproteobacteria bacterium]